MIEAKNLTKIFKVPTEEKSIFGVKKIDSAAVDDLSFSLKKGEVLSLLGPNGCGKTTTLRMLAGMLEPSKGCLLYTSPSPRDKTVSRMPSSA